MVSELTYTEEERQVFLQSLKCKEDEYSRIIDEDTTQHKTEFWDVIVITAIDEIQQGFYEDQIKQKVLSRELPERCEYHVIPDPKGPKIGCGGSTFVALRFLEQYYGSRTDNMKILLVHAGGYSKRLINHSISGKIFCPIPIQLSKSGAHISMLELKLIMFVHFPKKMLPGCYVTCADDIVLFGLQDLDFTQPGITALAHPSSISVGLGHGVFVLDGEEINQLSLQSSTRPLKCIRYLHKPTEDLMRQSGAIVGKDYDVFVDSSFFMDRNVCKMLLKFESHNTIDVELEAYGDFLQPLGEDATDTYFNNTRTTGGINHRLTELRQKIYDLFQSQKVQFQVIPLIPSLFVHLGTTEEYITHLTLDLPKFGFESCMGNHFYDGADPLSTRSDICLQRNIIGQKVQLGSQTVIEYSQLIPKEGLSIGSQSILSQVRLPEDIKQVPDQSFLHTIMLDGGNNDHHPTSFATIALGTSDDMKLSVSREDFITNGGKHLVLRGVPVSNILSRLGLSVDQVWDSTENVLSLWSAKLFPVASSPEESARLAMLLINGQEGEGAMKYGTVTRTSLAASVKQRNLIGQTQFFREHHELDIIFQKLSRQFYDEVDANEWISSVPQLKWIVELLHRDQKDEEKWKHWCEQLDQLFTYCEDRLGNQNQLSKSRALFSLNTIIGGVTSNLPLDHPASEKFKERSKAGLQKAWNALRDLILSPFLTGLKRNPLEGANERPIGYFLDSHTQSLPLSPGIKANIALPARIVISGGWSDTPPYSLDHEGQCVNFAVTIEGKLPVNVTAEVIERPVVILTTVDGKSTAEFSVENLSSLFGYQPGESLALLKAAFCFTFFPQFCSHQVLGRDGASDIALSLLFRQLFGKGGISIRTEVDIPFGSGLGTSSILMLGVLRVLRKLVGIPWSNRLLSESSLEMDKEMNGVLAVEQMLTTGGGWQDQIGGGIDGLKFTLAKGIITSPESCFPQYYVETLKLDEKHLDFFNRHLLVVYTGLNRMAKTILYSVVDHWFIRKMDTVECMHEIQRKAAENREIFQRFISAQTEDEMYRVWEELGTLTTAVRGLNIRLEKAFSNPQLDSLFDALSDMVTGSHLIGAGSGGFVVGWLRKGETHERVASTIAVSHPEARVTKMALWQPSE